VKNRNIIMSAADHAELGFLIASGGKISERASAELKGLESELERAQIVAPEAVPPNVITMKSRAELLDLDTGESIEFTLVFPSEANIDDGKISVHRLTQRCSANRVGDEFEWAVPYGLRRLKVTYVHFQPEAALATTA
jgi:regulator of nucleoside diphosphate kinase